ncbi:MAG: hypothetical protein PHC86_03800 [Eubacteriales bacterium]|nr:hypothetical protein [Eubacteriales bacterium]
MSAWITLPPQFTSGMVIQQQAKTRLSGLTDANLELSLELIRTPFDKHAVSPLDPNYGVIYTAALKSDKNGRFQFDLPALKASFDPIELLISDSERTLRLTHLLVGEVYLLIGDSTLSIPLADSTAQLASDHTSIPYLRLLDLARRDPENCWHAADQPTELLSKSALGLMFGRELILELRMPIGLIQVLLPGRKIRDWQPDNKKGQAARLLDPLHHFCLRGIVWSGSQKDLGETTNATEIIKLAEQLRARLLPIESKPAAFLMLLHPTHFINQKNATALTMANENLSYCAHHLAAPTALVPVSNTVASNHLAMIAYRLRTVCLGLLYQRKAPHSAPECESIELVGGKMMISFSHAGEGLRLTGDDTRVRGFAVCGPDRIYHEAMARVLYGVRVMVWHDAIPNPLGVTYGFSDNHCGNVISKDQLPVVPFRSDQQPAVYSLPREWVHADDPSQWQVFAGQMSISREKANKSEGEAALKITYQATAGQTITGSGQPETGPSAFTFGPLIDRREDFPPLNLSHANQLLVDIFNPDRVEKTIKLNLYAIAAPGAREYTTEAQRIVPALRWQTITFDLDTLRNDLDLAQIIRLKFILTDPNNRGLIYLDNIRV